MADHEDYIEDDLFGAEMEDGDEGAGDANSGAAQAEGAAAASPNQDDPSDPAKNGGEVSFGAPIRVPRDATDVPGCSNDVS